MASWLQDVRPGVDPPRGTAKADRTTRLFAANGQPAHTHEQQQLIRECERLIKIVDQARGELVDAVALDDPDLCVAAARRFLALGLMFADRARFSF